jgi:hypothetical protein
VSANEIFKGKTRWSTYKAEHHLDTLVGGIPKDPDTIRAWLKSKLEIGEAEIVAIADETIAAMGWTAADLGSKELDEVVDAVLARDTKGNSFKQVKGELVIEGRQIKAAIKEAANSLYPGVKKWPDHPGEGTRKGLGNYLVERVEVWERYIPIGRKEPDIVGEQRIKHITGPTGKRSTINVVDLCEEVDISFTVKVLDDFINDELWGQIWEYVELGGIGADRARGDGRGQLTKWTKVK